MGEARGLVVAAPASGSGKTVVTLGLLRALAKAGITVASAKAGPDYIDPRFHAAATERPCPNIDVWAMRPGLVDRLCGEVAEDSELFVVEGVMGLFDGAEGGQGSTADIAAHLGLPVVLVVDARAQAHSAAALVKGFAEFRKDCRVGGVIFNRVASARHESVLRSALAPLGIPVIGAVRQTAGLELPSRHLGLVQAEEVKGLEGFLDRASGLVTEGLDMALLRGVARPPHAGLGAGVKPLAPLGQRIAVAADAAFGFAYPHLLEGWRALGAEISTFSPLADEAPREAADAVFLPGGYPELHAGRISANEAFLGGLRSARDRGTLIYGECGGYMVMGEALIDREGQAHAMAGLLPSSTSFAERRLQLGYRYLNHDGVLPWPKNLTGHEFHFSTLSSQGGGDSLFQAADSGGRQIGPMGERIGRVMGSYAHVIDACSRAA